MAKDEQKTTMTVAEMRILLGLKKTESYYLVHKGCFEVVTIGGKMRILLESFERWYANQTHYQKITGEQPGIELSNATYSIQEVANLLNLNKSYVYNVLLKQNIPVVIVQHCKRVPKESFHRWLASQQHYKAAEEREREAERSYAITSTRASVQKRRTPLPAALPEKAHLTLQEAASILKLRDTEMYRMIQRGQLRGRKIGRSWYISRADLTEWMQNSFQ